MAEPSSASHGLAEIVPYADWDSVMSMALSLRLYLYEHATIPTWNFMFCGGRPELAVPFSWAWAWPSLFAYALPPLHALVAVWALLTAVGLWAMYGLLLRWTGSRIGALAGASVFALSGSFAMRFNVGHITFAFHHLVPLLMLLFERSVGAASERRRLAGLSLASLMTAFALMSGGLPHTLLHMVPAILLHVALRTVFSIRELGVTRALRVVAAPIAASAIGVWMAAYRIWPAATWPSVPPRVKVHEEYYSPLSVFLNTQIFSSGFRGRENAQAWHVYPPNEYNAFVGPLPWLLGALALAFLAWRGWKGRKESRGRPDPVPPTLAVVCIAVGFTLSLGAGHPFSPLALFSDVPVSNVVRVFARYQILIVFGLAILSALGLAGLERIIPSGGWRRLAAGLLLAGVALPVLAQSATLIMAMETRRASTLIEDLPMEAPPVPMLVRKRHRAPPPTGFGRQSALLDRGYWIANCYTNLSLPPPGIERSRHRLTAVSEPPPTALEALGRNSFRLRYDAQGEEVIRLHLRVPDGSRLNVPARRSPAGHLLVSRSDLDDGILEASVRYPGPAVGVAHSLAALVTGAGMLLWMRRRDLRR